jgi:hypothetical protein
MTYKGGDVKIHVFLTSALVAGEWSASHPGRFNPVPTGYEAGGPQASEHRVSKHFLPISGLALRPLCHPARVGPKEKNFSPDWELNTGRPATLSTKLSATSDSELII